MVSIAQFDVQCFATFNHFCNSRPQQHGYVILAMSLRYCFANIRWSDSTHELVGAFNDGYRPRLWSQACRRFEADGSATDNDDGRSAPPRHPGAYRKRVIDGANHVPSGMSRPRRAAGTGPRRYDQALPLYARAIIQMSHMIRAIHGDNASSQEELHVQLVPLC
jgi:hypothetical protein